MRRSGGLMACALLVLLATACRPPVPPVTAPSHRELTPFLGVPPALEDRLIYYHGFEQIGGRPEVNAADAAQVGNVNSVPEGMRGRGALTGKSGALQLRSPELSPHKPLTVMFWWALAEDAKIDSGFGLAHLQGRGIISHFSRGKGDWCALQRNAAILQVYYFPGIQNVNGIYDADWAEHIELRTGVWHHTALVIQGASLVEVYTDGRLAWSVRTDGRPFNEEDRLSDLTIGTRGSPGVAIDEVLILRRALTAGEIAGYVAAIRQMRQVGYPEH
ncbi:MAG TPA: LamG-like jellyroll fold domain-containing protein [Planctomycetota bacterium]|nr:LamG-like jellyroll fold domain-containing protein [Planctomycetota bacterium]